MKIGFVTLFPDWIRNSVSQSILNRAAANGFVEFYCINPRDYCYDTHKKVDDVPYGGHPGMLLRSEPVAVAIDHLVRQFGDGKSAIIFTEPSGVRFDQAEAVNFSEFDWLIFVCGHYEGIDHRVEETYATHVFSIGDFVLTNGELPALVMTDAIVRRIPGVLGNGASVERESFEANRLSAPNYTRPEIWRGLSIPDVLKSGHHAKIIAWENTESLKRTQERRPDLLD
jgi:tRNA (guanine37-N1)-methyltransferase